VLEALAKAFGVKNADVVLVHGRAFAFPNWSRSMVIPTRLAFGLTQLLRAPKD